LHNAGLDANTLVIIEAKHGQSPINVKLRQMADDSLYDGTPGFGSNGSKTTDDVALIWLSPQMQLSGYRAARAYLLSLTTILGIDTLLDNSELGPLYGSPFHNNRTPDFIAITTPGLIYTGGTKLAEHGGFAKDDRNVALLVSNPSITAATVKDNVRPDRLPRPSSASSGSIPGNWKACGKRTRRCCRVSEVETLVGALGGPGRTLSAHRSVMRSSSGHRRYDRSLRAGEARTTAIGGFFNARP